MPWAATEANALFAGARIDQATGRRFATARGIAFEAKNSADGTWHGFPVPWESVPARIKDEWRKRRLVTRRQLNASLSVGKGDIHWALKTDDR